MTKIQDPYITAFLIKFLANLFLRLMEYSLQLGICLLFQKSTYSRLFCFLHSLWSSCFVLSASVSCYRTCEVSKRCDLFKNFSIHISTNMLSSFSICILLYMFMILRFHGQIFIQFSVRGGHSSIRVSKGSRMSRIKRRPASCSSSPPCSVQLLLCNLIRPFC